MGPGALPTSTPHPPLPSTAREADQAVSGAERNPQEGGPSSAQGGHVGRGMRFAQRQEISEIQQGRVGSRGGGCLWMHSQTWSFRDQQPRASTVCKPLSPTDRLSSTRRWKEPSGESRCADSHRSDPGKRRRALDRQPGTTLRKGGGLPTCPGGQTVPSSSSRPSPANAVSKEAQGRGWDLSVTPSPRRVRIEQLSASQ